MLSELHPLENLSSLFVFQLWRFHKHHGKWIAIHFTKKYLYVYIYGNILMSIHTCINIVEYTR